MLKLTNIANICVQIGNTLKSAISKDISFSLGLLNYYCGIPVMAMKHPEYHKTFARALKFPNVLITTIGDMTYKANHATIGYYVSSS